jgi:hypothetical protein
VTQICDFYCTDKKTWNLRLTGFWNDRSRECAARRSREQRELFNRKDRKDRKERRREIGVELNQNPLSKN